MSLKKPKVYQYFEPEEPEIDDVDFPEFRGLTFREFWDALPRKLEFTDYEQELAEALEEGRKLWVKKATGLGITEFTIRWIAWNCLKDDTWKDAQVDVSAVIITGANQELTNKVIGRIKGLFDYEFKSKVSVVILNGCRIEAFPTNHLEPARGLNPRVVFLDEADFFPLRYQDEARTMAERYIPKSKPHIIMVSTPNVPGGLYERMEEEGEKKNGYIMKQMDYTRGIGTVFSREDIEEAMKSPSFEREYNLKYGHGEGNIFEGIEDIIMEYDLTLQGGQKGVYGDPAYGSSNFGVLGAEKLDNIVYIKECNEYPRPSPSAMLDRITTMAQYYDNHVNIDSAHPGLIRDLQDNGIDASPVNFGLQIRDGESASQQSLRSKMTINAAQMIKNKVVRIHPDMTKLISQLRAAQFDKTGGVDKKDLNFDIGDCFLMACWDLKEYDYSHVDIINNTVRDRTNNKDDDITPPKKGLSVSTEQVGEDIDYEDTEY